MRLSAFLMALLFSALAFQPCADNAEFDSPHKIEEGSSHLEQSATVPCGDHSHDANDGCSPLCLCHCCHTHVSFNFTTFQLGSLAFSPELNIFYIEPSTDSPVNSLFRPPKV